MYQLFFALMSLRRRSLQVDGQGLAEYALLLGLIAMVAIVALVFLGSSINGLLTNLSTPL